MGTKRNIKALKRLRAVFEKVPPHRVHMREVIGQAECGTVGCLLGWGTRDRQLRKMGLVMDAHEDPFFTLRTARKVLGLGPKTAERLFAFNGGPEFDRALRADPHAISKGQVLEQLDRVIAGRPIKPYVVAKAS
jgi:hypothetical protein